MNKARLLIVNEDRLTQKSLYELLCREGFKVEIASSVKESLPYLDANFYNIVVADINGKDGLKLLKII